MIWIPQILRGWIVLALAGALSGGHWVDADQPGLSSFLRVGYYWAGLMSLNDRRGGKPTILPSH
jgi:hypothetical protein